MSSPSSSSRAKLRWTQSWVLAGATGVVIVAAMEVSVPATFYLFQLVQGACCAVLWPASVRKNSSFTSVGTIVCWTLGWSLSRDLWPPNPPDPKYGLLLLRVAVSVIPMAAAAVCFPRYFMPKEKTGVAEGETPKTEVSQ